MIFGKERVVALTGGSVSLVMVVLALGEGIPGWIRWVCLGTGFVLVTLMVGGSGSARLELRESQQNLRRTRRQRDELERYFNALMETIPSSIYFKDRESRFLQVNRALAETVGAESSAEMIGKTDLDYFEADYAKKAHKDEVEIIESGEGYEKFVQKEIFPNGSEGWVLSSKLPFRDKQGRIVGTFGISSDVSQLIEAQENLERERNTLRTLLDGIPDSIYIRDFEGHYIVVNRALSDLVGADDPADVAGRTPFDFFPKEKAAAFVKEDLKVKENGGTVIRANTRLKNAQGETRYLQTTKVPVRDRDGLVWGVVGINRDVTEEEKTREALKQTEHRMQEIVDNSPSPIYAKSVTGQYLMVNRKFEELFHIKSKEAVGKTDADVLGDESLAARMRKYDILVAERGRAVQFERKISHPDGDRYYMFMKFPMRDLNGEIYAVGGISTDLTARRQAELGLLKLNQELMQAHDNLTSAHEQLIQAEKMESVGRLAAGVAHEVKNPLAMIGMGLELLARRLPPDDVKARETIERMKRGIERAKKIVRGLVDYSSNRRLEFHSQDPNLLVRGSLELVEYEMKQAGVEINFLAGKDLPKVEVDQTRIEQVLVNLFINATHAMEGGGKITIKTGLMNMENAPHDEGSRLRERTRSGDLMVKFEVADDGEGIPEEALGKLFDPFFTTKSTGKGTGLGLTVSRKIVELHGGDLGLANRKDGKGAVATLLLRVNKDSLGLD